MASVLGVIVFVGWVNLTVDLTNEMYAKWHIGNLLVEYLRDHDNEWPGSWDDIDEYLERYPILSACDNLSKVIFVDFSVSKDWICEHLDEIRTGEIKLVSAVSGSEAHWQDAEPNQIICDHFENRCPKRAE